MTSSGDREFRKWCSIADEPKNTPRFVRTMRRLRRDRIGELIEAAGYHLVKEEVMDQRTQIRNVMEQAMHLADWDEERSYGELASSAVDALADAGFHIVKPNPERYSLHYSDDPDWRISAWLRAIAEDTP